jgi:lipoic acid synthetase
MPNVQSPANPPPNLETRFLGTIPYDEALHLQKELVEQRQKDLIPDTLLLLEHPPVITMGRRADNTHLKVPVDHLVQHGISIKHIDRGGEATYHGPGQIVGYVILDLSKRKGFVRKFVWEIEEVFIRLLNEEYGIIANRDLKHRGVWIAERKITAIGISVKKNVTMHGFAFNVNTDISAYSLIVPCGIKDKGITSLEREIGRKLDMHLVMKQVERHFRNVFFPEQENPLPPLVRTRYNAAARKTDELIQTLRLNTVCTSASCPNRGECFSNRTATFMILGNICTRDCRFCDVVCGTPTPVDQDEPERIAQAVERLGLDYVVITSVTRDDLPDGGASHFADTIRAIHKRKPQTQVEVLIPDFKGSELALKKVLDAGCAVLNHNIETVPRLYFRVRPQADYAQSLSILKSAKKTHPHIPTKSGIMLGLGETEDEFLQTLKDLRDHSVNYITIGQYLAPSLRHHRIVKRLSDAEFEKYGLIAKGMGFESVASGRLVRSSYHAREMSMHQNSRTGRTL